MIPVTVFNADVLAMNLAVNGGPQQPIGGTNAALQWRPQVLINVIQLCPTGPPAANILATGKNTLAITPKGSSTPFNVTVTLPGSFIWTSAQLYLVFESTESAAWIILNQGQFVTGSLTSP